MSLKPLTKIKHEQKFMLLTNNGGPVCGEKRRTGAAFLPQTPLTTFFSAYIFELL